VPHGVIVAERNGRERGQTYGQCQKQILANGTETQVNIHSNLKPIKTEVMKNITALIVAALVGSVVSLGTYRWLEGDRYAANSIDTVVQPPVHRVNYGLTAPESSLNFAEAAKASINGVVHVKTKTMRNSQHYVHPFHHFFFDQGAPQMQPQMGSGSGVIISEDGYIMTNNHVIANADEVEVTLNDKRSYIAEVIGKDPNTDLAILKIKEEGLHYVPYGNSDELEVGDWVLAVGNPFNLTSTVTAGIVSAKGRNINILNEEFAIESFIQTDAAVNPGNSGGALVNTKGELIGINTAIASNTGAYTGYSFAVPVNVARKVVNDLIEFGAVQRAFIGVSIRDLDGKLAAEKGVKMTEGAYVNGLSEDGAAAEAGIKEGDIIVAIDGIAVKNVPALQERIGTYRPGDVVEVNVVRNEELKKMKVTLRNQRGDTGLVPKTSEVLVKLGATLEPVSTDEMRKLGIHKGIKVKGLGKGKLKDAGVREGFIITRVDRKEIGSPEEVAKMLDRKGGGVLIEGVYPNGLTAYYGFGL
jgi:serine protease Do